MDATRQYEMLANLQAVLNLYLAQQPAIVLAYLFGSVARGQATPLSDIDIAILLDASLDEAQRLNTHLDIAVAVAELLGEKAQVTLLNNAPPFLAYNVIRDGILLYKRTEAERVAFVVRTMKLYFDFKPALEFHQQKLLERIEEHGLGYRKERDNGTLEAAKRLHQRLTRSSKR